MKPDQSRYSFNVIFALCSLLFSSFVVTAEPTKDAESKVLAEAIGSLRNARIAIEVTGPRMELTYFASSMSEAALADVARLAPNLRIVTGLSKSEALARADEAHGIDARFASPEFLAKATNLRWVQVSSAGVDRYLSNESLMNNDAIVMSNFRGIHGPAIADHAMAILLSLTRNLNHYAVGQRQAKWVSGKEAYKSVGLGGIGIEIAQRANGFGMRVIGTRRSDSPSPDYIEQVGKPQDLLAMLPEADVVALAVPLTDETRNLLDAAAFKQMKPGAYLINIARGKVVNTDAMLQALKSGRLAGACLDVTDPEPLPDNHELWKQPNVIITPHIAGRSAVTDERRAALLVENLRRFGSGEPILNVVDKKAGY